MLKAVGLILLIAGAIALVLGVLGIFGNNFTPIHPWALAILGLIFFSSGLGLLKRSENDNR